MPCSRRGSTRLRRIQEVARGLVLSRSSMWSSYTRTSPSQSALFIRLSQRRLPSSVVIHWRRTEMSCKPPLGFLERLRMREGMV